MKTLKSRFVSCWPICILMAGVTLTGCTTAETKSPDVTENVRHSLDSAGMKDVSVSQDRDKGVVTLGGHVPTDSEKAQAESMARSFAGGQVVANQIAVLPPGVEGDVKKIDSALDQGIKKNLEAAMIQNGLNKSVDYKIVNGVVTLTGTVNSERMRGDVARIAGSVPNVQQVVNEVQVKNQKASSN